MPKKAIESSLYDHLRMWNLMREVTVKFTIYDEDEERLKKITEEYKKQHNF